MDPRKFLEQQLVTLRNENLRLKAELDRQGITLKEFGTTNQRLALNEAALRLVIKALADTPTR